VLVYTYYFTFTVIWISKVKFEYTLCHVFPLCIKISRMRHHTLVLKSCTVKSCIMVLFWGLALSLSSRSVLLHLSGSCWFVCQSVDVMPLPYAHTLGSWIRVRLGNPRSQCKPCSVLLNIEILSLWLNRAVLRSVDCLLPTNALNVNFI
jgi:hypothetical protein